MEPQTSRPVPRPVITLIAAVLTVAAVFYLFDSSATKVPVPGFVHRVASVENKLFTSKDQSSATRAVKEEVPAAAYYLYFNRASADSCVAFYPVVRYGADGRGREAAALVALLSGPTPAEKENGVTSFFSPDTADMLRSITVKGSTAYVDFPAISKRIKTSQAACARNALRASVDKTLKQFGSVTEVRYLLNGSSGAFEQWSKSY